MYYKRSLRFVIVSATLLLLSVMAYTKFFAAAQGLRLAYGETVTGEITGGADADMWTFEGSRGDVVLLQVTRVDGSLLPAITITGPDDALLLDLAAQDPQLPDLEFALGLQRTGAHTLSVEGAGGTTGNYMLTLALRSVAGSLAVQDSMLVYGRTKTSAISDAVFREFWSFQGTRGDVVDVQMATVSGDLDAYLSLQAPDGTVIASSDIGEGTQDAALYAVRLNMTGRYTVVARRAGANLGEAGTTSGEYTIGVFLRAPGSAEGTPTPVELTLDRMLRGRLSADAPAALFSVEADGVLALALKTTAPDQISALSVMTSEGAPIDSISGVSPLQTSVPLPGPGAYWIEVFAADIQPDRVVDFSLVATRLATATRTSRALQYNRPQVIGANAAPPELWHFYGKRGDLITLRMQTFGPASVEGALRVFAPDNTLLLEHSLQHAVVQPLQLTTDGVYEIALPAADISNGYVIGISRTGLAGLSFEQHATPRTENMFPTAKGAVAEGVVQPYATDAWFFDVADSLTWRFTVTAIDSNLPLVLAVEAPDGTWLEHAVTDRLAHTARVQLDLDQVGRYRVLVVDLSGSNATTYRLSGKPVEGGMLQSHVPQKGVIAPDEAYDLWYVESAPDELIQVRIALQAGATTLPEVHVIGPDGKAITSNIQVDRAAASGTLSVFAETGGVHTILVRQAPVGERVVYRIAVDVTRPFEAAGGQGVAVSSPLDAMLATGVTPLPQAAQVDISGAIIPVLPSEPETSVASRNRDIAFGTLLRGMIEPGAQFDVWTFSASANQLLEFSVVALNSGAGPDLIVLDANGQVVSERFTIEKVETYLMHRFAQAGSYTLLVHLDHSGPYTLQIDALDQIDERVPAVAPGRTIAYGETRHDELIAGEGARSFVFYAQAGDVVMAQAAAIDVELSLALALKPLAGSTLAAAEAAPDVRIVGLDAVALPETGLYQVAVHYGTAWPAVDGAFALRLDLVRAEQTIPFARGELDAPATAYLRASRSPQTWLFSAHSGERVTLRVEPLVVGVPAPLAVQLADSYGNVFVQRTARFGTGTLVLGDVSLPRTGIYQVRVEGGQREAGSYRITLERDRRDVHDIGRTLRYGESISEVFTPGNFLDVWTFAGSRGDVISVSAQRVFGDTAPLTLQLRTDTGHALTTAAPDDSTGGAQIRQFSLPRTGHYTLIAGIPEAGFQGEMAYRITLSLKGTTARSTGMPLAYGDTVAGAFFVDDPADAWVFEGRQGDIVTAQIESTTAGMNPSLTLLSTEWHAASVTEQRQVLASGTTDETGIAQVTFTLPLDGPYALLAQSPDLTSGQYRLRLINENPVAGPAQPLRIGQVREGQITDSTDVDGWRFDGVAGEVVTVTVEPDSRANLSPHVALFGADGRMLAQADAAPGDSATVPTYRLPYTGSYTARVARSQAFLGRTTGRYTIHIVQDAPPAGTDYPSIRLGTAERGTLDDASPARRWVFDGTAGDTIYARLEATSRTLDPVLRLYVPEGPLLAEADDVAPVATDAELYVKLPVDGPYVLEARRYHGAQGATEGNFLLNVERVYQASETSAEPSIAYGDYIAGTTDRANPSDIWTFSGKAGDRIFAMLRSPTDDAPSGLLLRDAAGNTLASGTRDLGDVVIDGYTLAADAIYTLEVRRPGDAVARFSPYTMNLDLLDTAITAPASQDVFLNRAGTVTGQFRDGVAVHSWLFEGQAGQDVALSLAPLYGPLSVSLSVLAPDGTLLFTDAIEEQTRIFTTGMLTLPVSGTYVLRLEALGLMPGVVYRLTLLPNVPASHLETIAAGEDRIGSIAAARAYERWQFTAPAGMVIDVRVVRIGGNLTPTVALLSPTGRSLAEGYAIGDAQAAITRYTLPETGDYTLVVSREGGVQGTTGGSYRLMLRRQPISVQAAVAHEIALGAEQAGVVDGSAPVWYTFQAQAGDNIALAVRDTVGLTPPALQLETEAGRVLDVPVTRMAAESGIWSFDVPYTGYYVVGLSSADTVNYTFTAYRRPKVPAENNLVRALGRGQAFVEGVIDPSAPVFWRFEGTQGEVLAFTVDTTSSNLRADVTLFGPQGFVANVVEGPGDAQTVLGPVRLPADGDYVLTVGAWLGPAGGTTGRFSVRVEAAAAGVSGSDGGQIVAYGQPVFGGLTPQDTRDQWTFSGQAGETVVVRVSHPATDSTVALTLRDPENNVVGTGVLALAYTGVEISDVELGTTGTYTITLEGQFADEQPIEYQLSVLSERTPLISQTTPAQAITYGDRVLSELPDPPASDAWIFYGQAGDNVRGTVTANDPALGFAVYLLSPDGTILQRVTAGGTGEAALDVLLPLDGFHALVVQRNDTPDGGVQGTYAIYLERTAAHGAQQGVLIGTRRHTLTPTSPAHIWELRPAHSGRYAIVMQSFTPGGQPSLHVISGTNEQLAAGESTPSGTMIAQATLTAGEQYGVVVTNGITPTHVHYEIQLVPASMLAIGEEFVVGEADVGRITDAHFTDEWRFDARMGEAVAVAVRRTAGDLVPLAAVYDSDGLLLHEAEADGQGRITFSFQPPADGTYRLVITRTNLAAGATSGDYTVELTHQAGDS